jgi:hypothetical protein
MSKQTAVEWLIEKIHKDLIHKSMGQIYGQAKQMEKEQMESAYFSGSCDRMNDEGSFEQYYKETYEREDNKH